MNENEMRENEVQESEVVETEIPEVVEAPEEEIVECPVEEAAEAPVEEAAEAPVEEVAEVPVEESPAEEAAPAGKKKLKPLTMIVAAVVAVLVIIGIVAAIVLSGPLATVKKGVDRSIDAIGNNETVALVGGLVNGGSVELSCDLEDITESMIGFGMDGSAYVKLYTDLDGKALALEADVNMDGESVIDGLAVINEKGIALESDLLFGGKAYGVGLKDLSEKFESSIFGPDGDYALGIELPEQADSAIADVEKFAKDSEKIAKSAVTELVGSLKKNAEIKKSGDKLQFAGNDVKTSAVTVKVNGEALGLVAVDMLEYVRGDKALKSFLYENAGYLAQAYGYYDEPEVMLDEFYERLDMIAEDDYSSVTEGLEDVDFDMSVTFHVAKSSKQLVGIEFVLDQDGDKIKVSAFAGPDLAEIEEISFRYDDGYDVYRGSYSVTANSGKEYAAKLKVREDSEVIFEGKLDWDKKKGDFEIEFGDEWESYGAEGYLKKSGKTLEITLDSISEGSDEMDLGINAVVKASDSMPGMPKYTDLLTMSTEEFEELIYELGDLFGELSYLF